ncbi:MAG: hypothetical protein HYY40_11805 [Bacteroidetes bacterium]|nr:hypothetical protein [Bacteroidota bacterium]
MFISLIRHRFFKAISLFVAFVFLTQLVAPSVAWALTGGPSQPEVQSFEPVGTTEMVDPFTGDFVYNIPLIDVGGYPVNLSYHSGITMDQEASWVGLGWNINAGVINRGMRGMPDDFKGDLVKKTFHMKPNITYGGNLQIGDIEIVGAPFINLSLGVGFGIFYNNYKGVGYELSLDPNIGIGDKEKGSLNIGLGLSANSQEGIGVEPTLGFSVNATKTVGKDASTSSLNAQIGAPYNSRSGLKALTLSASVSANVTRKVTPQKRITTYRSASPGFSTTIPVNMQTYIPQISMSMLNTSATFSAGIGGEGKWVNFKGRFSGYLHTQSLLFNELELPAYGYIYADAGQNNPIALHDFNREKDGAFNDQTPALALTQHTYDVYNVTAQGIGGMYRPYRGDAGRVYDNMGMSISTAIQGGGDLGAGDIVKGGVNAGFNFSLSTSGDWSDGKGPYDAGLSFRPPVPDQQFEPFYFKQAGELVPNNTDFFNAYGGDDPVRIETTKEGNAMLPMKKKGINGSELPLSSVGLTKVNREHRNQVISILTAQEASNASLPLDPDLGHNIVSFDAAGIPSLIPRVDAARAKDDHISELSVLRPDGSRYIFGIPAYNLSQKEVTFNAGPNLETGVQALYDCTTPTGLLTYSSTGSNPDNSTKNKRGIDNYYQSTELPPFAHSYLLTAVLSPDYVDRTSNGPTDDDFGTYTKFNYTRVYGDYHWRVPFETDKANYNEGMKSDDTDDKASYIYGTKEVWYLHSIETKTHRADFTISARHDGFGVDGENGGILNSRPSYELDKITLYSKCDRLTNATPIVIKEVNFVYDYSLCPGVPNSDNAGGKLTLKQVYFTYGKSFKGKLSPYKFIYADPDYDGNPDADYNPNYSLKEYDRWGNYKPDEATGCTTGEANSEFPYVKQNKTDADIYSQAWHLTTVKLPSGGTINIDYESDDYAFVQDKRAMQMVKVEGAGSDPAANTSVLYESTIANRYIRFQLPVPVSGKTDFENKYLRDENGNVMTDIYFRFFIDLIGYQGGSHSTGDEFEYVSGYADIESYDVIGTGEAYIILKSDDFKDKPDNDDVNPIAKTAWQFARLNLSRLIYPGSQPKSDDEGGLRSLLGLLTDITTMFNGFNKTLRDWGFGKRFIPGKSLIRLHNPSWKKFGGGSRVKKITICDQWTVMLGGVINCEVQYGQEYFYTKILEGTATTNNSGGLTISSGVAEYEPMVGNEENPWRQPKSFTNKNRLAPDDRFYQETPYGEMFFPSPNVGYSRVTVRNLQYTGVKRNATGHVVHEFYTARDFPVFTRNTGVDKKRDKPSWITKILKIEVEDYMTAGQGFVIELNDMHGKPKAQWVYPEYPAGTRMADMSPISGVEYFYRTESKNSKKLSNEVVSITKTGNLVNGVTVGKEMDIIGDFRENYTRSFGGSFQGNLDCSLFPFPPAPVPIPSLWVSFTSEKTRFRSVTTTKVVTRYGILRETVAYDLGSRVSTENLAYDHETGEVLLTRTRNEFRDPIYSFTYPAHWAYKGMGMAFTNIGFEFNADINSGVLTFSNVSDFLNPGDELMINTRTYWVKDISGTSITIVNRFGIVPVGLSGNNTTIKVIRSGRRNMQTVPIGTVTSKSDPFSSGQLNFSGVLNASAVEFTDQWDAYCECGVDPDLGNPYINGSRGNWRAKRSLLFLTPRNQSSLNNNTNTRDDGTYKVFSPYWQKQIPEQWTPNTAALNQTEGWTYTSVVTKFNPFGFEIENRDALSRYSSAVYGFGNTLPTSVSSNARYRDVGFESFEDEDCNTCTDEEDHFSFQAGSKLNNSSSHTGTNSIKIGTGQKLIMTKLFEECEE